MDALVPKSRRSLVLFVALGAAIVYSLGCLQKEDPNTFHTEGRPDSSPPRPVIGAYAYPPEPPVTDSLMLKDFTDRYRDHVVLLDFWAGWCAQCRSDMPRIVQMQNELRASGFQVISCNLDETSAWSMQTVPFLKSVSASFPCVVVPRSAKAPLRSWLGEDWNYTLPARFLIGTDGTVIARLTEGTTTEQLAMEVDRAVRGATGETTRVARGGAQLRLKVIDTATGEVHSYPTIYSNPPNSGALGTRIADAVAGRVSNRTRRIAVLPICGTGSPTQATPFGTQVADQTLSALRRSGYMDLVEPGDALRQLDEHKLSVASIEFDPGVVRGYVEADYVVLGWLGGKEDRVSSSEERRRDEQ